MIDYAVQDPAARRGFYIVRRDAFNMQWQAYSYSACYDSIVDPQGLLETISLGRAQAGSQIDN